MKKYCIILLGLLFSVTIVSSQKMTDQEYKMSKGIAYMQCMNQLERQKTQLNEFDTLINYNFKFYQPHIYEASEIDELVSLIIAKSTLKIASDSRILNKMALEFSCTLPSNDSYPNSSLYNIEFVESNLKYGDSELNLLDYRATNCSEESFNYQIAIDSLQPEGISGEMTYKIDFCSGFEKIKLSRADTSKIFSLDTFKYQLLKVDKNTVSILDKSENVSKDLVLINLSRDGKQAIKSRLYAYLNTVNLENSTNEYLGHEDWPNKKSFIHKVMYDYCLENSELEPEEYVKNISNEMIDNMGHEKVITFNNIAEFGEEFIIYKPIYTSKIVSIKWNSE